MTGNKSLAKDTLLNAIASVQVSALEPAWDELKQVTVFKGEPLPWHPSFGRAFDDHILRLVRLMIMERFKKNAFQPSKENIFDAVMTIALGNKFNPVIDYLDSLEWDGVPRVQNLFGDYFNCGHDDYVRAVSTCFMVGAVRRMRSPGHKFDTMPVLSGPQGWNKSTAVRALFGDSWFSDADLGDLGSKDAAMLLRGIWVQEFAEINAVRNADVNTLKAFCSRAVDRMRDPYDRAVRDVPRRCVFIGTANESGYLKDGTGNRRFWPLTLTREIEVAPISRDRDQLWAEAARMESDGVLDTLPRALWSVAAERQAEQTALDPWIDEIRDFLKERSEDEANYVPGADDDEDKPRPADKVLTAELFDAIGVERHRQTRALAQRMRAVMVDGLKWKYSRGVRIGGQTGAGYQAPENVEHR